MMSLHLRKVERYRGMGELTQTTYIGTTYYYHLKQFNWVAILNEARNVLAGDKTNKEHWIPQGEEDIVYCEDEDGCSIDIRDDNLSGYNYTYLGAICRAMVNLYGIGFSTGFWHEPDEELDSYGIDDFDPRDHFANFDEVCQILESFIFLVYGNQKYEFDLQEWYLVDLSIKNKIKQIKNEENFLRKYYPSLAEILA